MTARPEWAIPCPWCHATPGNRCTRPSGGHLPIPSHDARKTAYDQQTRTETNHETGDTP